MNAMKPFLFLLFAGIVQCCELIEVDKLRAKCHQTAKSLDDEKNNNLNYLNQLLPKERTRFLVDAQNGKKNYYKMNLFAKHSVDIPQIVASYLEPQETYRMKSATKKLDNLKITGKLNLFPNESTVQVFRNLEAKNGVNEISWEDPNNLISNQRRTNMEKCLGLAENILDCLSVKVSAECLIDEVLGWGPHFLKAELYPFFKMVLKNVLDHDVVDAERKKTCKKRLMREAIVANAPKDVSRLISRKRDMSFEEIVDDKVSLEEAIYRGVKPLFFALAYDSEKNYFEIVKILLEAGAEVNSESNFGCTALERAAKHRNVEIVKLLLENNAEVNLHCMSNWRQTPLHNAGECRVEVVKLLLDAGAHIDAEDDNHWTPLIHTAIAGNVASAKMLIKRGAKLNISDSKGRTALMWAARFGNIEKVKVLLDAGANTEKRSVKGTAAEIAVQNGHQNCADLINKYALN